MSYHVKTTLCHEITTYNILIVDKLSKTKKKLPFIILWTMSSAYKLYKLVCSFLAMPIGQTCMFFFDHTYRPNSYVLFWPCLSAKLVCSFSAMPIGQTCMFAIANAHAHTLHVFVMCYLFTVGQLARGVCALESSIWWMQLRCTFALTSMHSDWMSSTSSGLCIM